MTKNIPVEKILSIAKSGGGSLAELYCEETSTAIISHESGKFEKAVEGIDSGFGLRIVSGEKNIYGFTNDHTKLEELAKSLATFGSKISANTAKQFGPDICLPEIQNDLGTKTVKEPQTAVSLVERAAAFSWGYSPLIKQVQITLRHSEKRVRIFNTNGLAADDTRKDLIMVVLVVAEKNGIIQTGYDPIGGTVGYDFFEKYAPEELAKSAADRAILMLDARSAPRKVMPVVISSSAGGTMIHEAVGHGLEADLASNKMSVYQDKLGTSVASNVVTVVDDATIKGLRGTYAFDDEGTPAQRTVLIENGVLKNYMQTKATAEKMGLKPTGNCRRESYRQRPICRMSNTMVVPGAHEPKNIIASLETGLLVKKMGGGQVNTINGDFVFEAQEAYLVRKGQICEPVRGATLIGNGPKILMEIDMVGTDIGYGIGTCGKDGQGVPVGHGMPTIRIPSITVGGSSNEK